MSKVTKYLQKNIILKEGIAVKAGVSTVLMGMIKKQIVLNKKVTFLTYLCHKIEENKSTEMIKRILVLVIAIQFVGCAELQKIASQLPSGGGVLSQEQIGNGLREALDNGIKNQVAKLTSQDGFYRNELVKILLPEELQAVDKGLRKIGLGNLADEGIKVLNRAAEDAVKTATPIFVDAVKEITFNDAKNILLGDKNAATSYLQSKTNDKLYQSFSPVINSSFAKVGADKIWSNLISKYNSIPFTKNVNPDLTSYVTDQALKGVFTMIEVEEKGIREKTGLRNTALLKQVFALQDNR
jgi:hypothetical protein